MLFFSVAQKDMKKMRYKLTFTLHVSRMPPFAKNSRLRKFALIQGS